MVYAGMSDSENTKEAVTCLENQSNFRASDVRIEENHDLIANLSLDSNLFEDRIRVDRRKLEQLMLGNITMFFRGSFET